MYLSLSKEDIRITLVEEFWLLMPDASDRKTARKAAYAGEMFPEGSMSKDTFDLLRDSRMIRSRHNLNRSERKRLEESWSFSRLVEKLSDGNEFSKPLVGVKSLLHMYGMSSHLIHADHIAIELLIDRNNRSTTELSLLQLFSYRSNCIRSLKSRLLLRIIVCASESRN